MLEVVGSIMLLILGGVVSRQIHSIIILVLHLTDHLHEQDDSSETIVVHVDPWWVTASQEYVVALMGWRVDQENGLHRFLGGQ